MDDRIKCSCEIDEYCPGNAPLLMDWNWHFWNNSWNTFSCCDNIFNWIKQKKTIRILHLYIYYRAGLLTFTLYCKTSIADTGEPPSSSEETSNTSFPFSSLKLFSAIYYLIIFVYRQYLNKMAVCGSWIKFEVVLT